MPGRSKRKDRCGAEAPGERECADDGSGLVWVQCNHITCEKWRRVSSSDVAIEAAQQEPWYCCSIAQTDTEENLTDTKLGEQCGGSPKRCSVCQKTRIINVTRNGTRTQDFDEWNCCSIESETSGPRKAHKSSRIFGGDPPSLGDCERWIICMNENCRKWRVNKNLAIKQKRPKNCCEIIEDKEVSQETENIIVDILNDGDDAALNNTTTPNVKQCSLCGKWRMASSQILSSAFTCCAQDCDLREFCSEVTDFEAEEEMFGAAKKSNDEDDFLSHIEGEVMSCTEFWKKLRDYGLLERCCVKKKYEFMCCEAGWEGSFMACCDVCDEWVHGACEGIVDESQCPYFFVCKGCRGLANILMESLKAITDEVRLAQAGEIQPFDSNAILCCSKNKKNGVLLHCKVCKGCFHKVCVWPWGKPTADDIYVCRQCNLLIYKTKKHWEDQKLNNECFLSCSVYSYQSSGTDTCRYSICEMCSNFFLSEFSMNGWEKELLCPKCCLDPDQLDIDVCGGNGENDDIDRGLFLFSKTESGGFREKKNSEQAFKGPCDILVHMHPEYLLILGDFTELSRASFPSKVVDFAATDPPSGASAPVNTWDKRISVFNFWMSIERLVKDDAAVTVMGAGQFVTDWAVRNRDLNAFINSDINESQSLKGYEAWKEFSGNFLKKEIFLPVRNGRKKDLYKDVFFSRGGGEGGNSPISPAIPVYRYNWYWLNNILGFPMLQHSMPQRFVEEICVFYKSPECVTYHPPYVALPFLSTVERSADDNRSYKGESSRAEYYFSADLKNCVSNFLPIPFEPFEFPGSARRPAGLPMLHPHRKPRKLFQFLVETYSENGDIVMDPFTGSGTTGEACMLSARRFIGTEIMYNHFKMARSRLDTYYRGTTFRTKDLRRLIRAWKEVDAVKAHSTE
eukprot:Nk52_evm25s2209 gene=Nk52_evmTU25s2209